MSEIPYGYCQCGCGQKTKIASRSKVSKGWIKGQPFRFIFGHTVRMVNLKPHTHIPIEHRFWNKVAKRGTDECWEWNGSRSRDGYGNVRVDPQHIGKAHRVAYKLTFGDIPDGLVVCHRCDNPPCCNPNHLFLGTRVDNAHDRDQKGRYGTPKRGELNGHSRLTTADVIKAKQLNLSGMSHSQIARLLDVSPSTICHALSGRNWAHLKLLLSTLKG